MRAIFSKRKSSVRKNGQDRIVSRSNKSKSAYGIFFNIDEVGSAKGLESQRCYAIVASKITDRFAFQDAVRSIADGNGITHELSFTGDRHLRDAVLDAIAEYIERVDYVYAQRPHGYEFVLNPKIIHKRLLEKMSEVLDLDPNEDVLIFVDSNDDVISRSKVEEIMNPTNSNHIECLVLPSRYFFELQGHDFITGGVGKELNESETTFTDKLRSRGTTITGRKIDFELRRRDEK